MSFKMPDYEPAEEPLKEKVKTWLVLLGLAVVIGAIVWFCFYSPF